MLIPYDGLDIYIMYMLQRYTGNKSIHFRLKGGCRSVEVFETEIVFAETRTPNLLIPADNANHLSYRGQIFPI